MAKLGLTAADQLTNLLAELELTPFSADAKRTSPANAALWQQGHMLALLYLDTSAAREAARLCRGLASGAIFTVTVLHNYQCGLSTFSADMSACE